MAEESESVLRALHPKPPRRQPSLNGATLHVEPAVERTTRSKIIMLNPGAPVVSFPADDAVTVAIPTDTGTLVFEAEQLQFSSRALDTTLTLRFDDAPFQTVYPPVGRHNLLSTSAKGNIRRELDMAYGRADWDRAITMAASIIRENFLHRDLSQRADQIERNPQGGVNHLIDGALLDGAPNIIFGSGESGKGLLSLAWALMVGGIVEVGGRTAERYGGVLLVDYEDDASEFARRWDGLLAGVGMSGASVPMFRWPARHVALADQIDGIQQKVAREGVILVIVDSGAPACGDKPEEAENTSRYFSAVASLGPDVTTLTICHQTKAQRENRDASSPFGSTFWRDRARRVWSARLAESSNPAVLDVTLVCRKNNRGRRPPPLGARIVFHDVEDGGDGSIAVEWREPRRERDTTLTEELPLKDRIYALLEQPMTVKEIIDALGLSPSEARRVGPRLSQWRGKLFEHVGDRWSRVVKQSSGER